MLILLDQYRFLFSKPFGPVFSDMGAVQTTYPNHIFCSVGDVVTEQLFCSQAPWFVAIIDGYTRRQRYQIGVPADVPVVMVDNPPGCISPLLMATVQDAVSHTSTKRTVIHVNGEEDLALLPLLLYAPNETVLLYGQPHEGIVTLTVNDVSRQLAHDYLQYFEDQ
jgi:uncharacterized protein (UPF0218 family)